MSPQLQAVLGDAFRMLRSTGDPGLLCQVLGTGDPSASQYLPHGTWDPGRPVPPWLRRAEGLCGEGADPGWALPGAANR